MNALQTIQQKLKAPKSQFNKFGNYAYRNCEDILEAIKPLLLETNSTLIIEDEVVEIAGIPFVKATATLHTTPTEGIYKYYNHKSTAFAMHAKEQKGMNEAQITGAASSYARKYALNGLFLIDDARDADATNDGTKIDKKKDAKSPDNKEPELPWLNEGSDNWKTVVENMKKGMTIQQVEQTFRISKASKAKLNEKHN